MTLKLINVAEIEKQHIRVLATLEALRAVAELVPTSANIARIDTLVQTLVRAVGAMKRGGV